jgi:methionine-rich copper-binding protein CopC
VFVGKVVAGAGAGVVLAGSVAFGVLYHEPEPQPQPKPTPVVIEEPAKPTPVVDAQISFTTDSELGGNVNPTSASLLLSDTNGVDISGWSIRDESGNVVAQGTGAKADIPENLREGQYSVIWNVSSADTHFSEITREFHISK